MRKTQFWFILLRSWQGHFQNGGIQAPNFSRRQNICGESFHLDRNILPIGMRKKQDKSLTIAIIMITRLGVLLQSYQAQLPLTRSSSARCPPTPPMPIISIMAIQGIRGGIVHIYFVSQYYWGAPSYSTILPVVSYTLHMGPNNHLQQCILVAGWRSLRISEGWT